MSEFRLRRVAGRPPGLASSMWIEPAGPDELANLAIELREWDRTQGGHFNSPLSDGALRLLVKSAYFASLHPYEGRFIDFAIYCAGPSELRDRVLFESPAPIDDPRALVRLAPMCMAEDVELHVAESDKGGLHVVGLGNSGDDAGWRRPGHVYGGEAHAGKILTLRSSGPARLHLHEHAFLALNRSIACVESEFQWVAGVQTVTDRAARLIHDGISKRFGLELARRAGGEHSVGDLVARSLRAVVAGMLQLGHGGMLVLLPCAASEIDATGKRFQDGRRVRTGAGIGSAVESYWNASLGVDVGSAQDVLDRQMNQQWIAHRELEQTVRSVIGLSLPDGAVVLDSRLDVISAATQIRIQDSDISSPQLKWRDLKDGYDLSADEAFAGLQRGTRHKAGLRTCFASPNTTVVVVSQDREVTCFWSDDSHVTGQGDVSAQPVGSLT